MSTENILVKQSLKPSGISDWNNTLKAIWANDNQRPSIYSNDHGGHYWDGRYSVQERSR